jgi:hypothetical protein
MSGAFVGGILSFGPTVTYYWTGSAHLYDPKIAVAMLAPLLAVAPLQQPMALLQYANRSREIGLLRLALIVLGPLGCVLGEMISGPTGLVFGLGAAEIVAYGALVPRLSTMSMLPGFLPYLLRTLAIGLVAAAICTASGLGLEAVVRPATLPLFLAEVAVWSCVVVLPLVYAALPNGLRRAARALLVPTLRAGFR